MTTAEARLHNIEVLFGAYIQLTKNLLPQSYCDDVLEVFDQYLESSELIGHDPYKFNFIKKLDNKEE
jgi:hypothetical protein